MNSFVCASALRDMGHQSRVDRMNNIYDSFLTRMIAEAQSGNLFVDFTIDEENWSLVNCLCDKITNQHHGVRIENNRGRRVGYASSIIVRWDN